MANYPYAHKTHNPIVGKIYRVAHAVMGYKLGSMMHEHHSNIKVPIHPHKHLDKEFAPNSPVHYHIDGRFEVSTDIKRRYAIDGKGRISVILITEAKDHCDYVVRIEFLNVKCVRKTTGLNVPQTALEGGLFGEWLKKMKGKSCAGKKCPHYGVIMSKVKGQLVCPLHGLVGDIKTEIII